MFLIYPFGVLIGSDKNHNYDNFYPFSHVIIVIYLPKLDNLLLMIVLSICLRYNAQNFIKIETCNE
jgi:hypothetical protein